MDLIYEVTSENKYESLKEILKCHFQISDNLLVKLKKFKMIYINNESVYINAPISLGDIIKINLDFNESSDNIIPTKMNLNILYEDESILVLNKPANTPIHPSAFHHSDSISNGVKYYFNSIKLNKKIRPVNRLDKDTSGIVIFAKNEYIQESLIKQMKNKVFKKEYLAILER